VADRRADTFQRLIPRLFTASRWWKISCG